MCLLWLCPQPESISLNNLIKFRSNNVLCRLILLFQHKIHLISISYTGSSFVETIRNVIESVRRITTDRRCLYLFLGMKRCAVPKVELILLGDLLTGTWIFDKESLFLFIMVSIFNNNIYSISL